MQAILLSIFGLILAFLFIRALVRLAIKQNDFTVILMLIIGGVAAFVAWSPAPDKPDAVLVAHVDDFSLVGSQLYYGDTAVSVRFPAYAPEVLERREEIELTKEFGQYVLVNQ